VDISARVVSRRCAPGPPVAGWLATAVSLELNGTIVTAAANDDVYELVIAVAAGGHSVDDIAQKLRRVVDRC